MITVWKIRELYIKEKRKLRSLCRNNRSRREKIKLRARKTVRTSKAVKVRRRLLKLGKCLNWEKRKPKAKKKIKQLKYPLLR